MDAPREPGAFRLLVGAGLGARLLGNLDDRLAPLPGAVDDRVARDRVEPGRARASLRAVARAERQTAAKVSCAASSARLLSPSCRTAMANTGRAKRR